MPESGVTKHNYSLCQFINPARGHEGERCDCYDTPSQKRTTLAKQRLICLRANRNINRASTSGTTESAVASDPAVTVEDICNSTGMKCALKVEQKSSQLPKSGHWRARAVCCLSLAHSPAGVPSLK